jgi:NodT family efflux transporter outer membrane factor (OMF) lipoprotein
MRHFILIPLCLALSGCITTGLDFFEPKQPTQWSAPNSQGFQAANAEELKQWWHRFNDPVLDELVTIALEKSPDRLIAEAKILEARGLRQTSRSSLFPQIGLSGSSGRQDTGSNNPSVDSFYDAGFDASFELDVFGKNRKNLSAAQSRIFASEAQYDDVSLTLIADVTRNYIDYRTAQNQFRIADKNLKSQQETLVLVQDLNRLGSAPRLDVERARNLVNTTRASLPEFQRQASNAALRLSVLTGSLPEALTPVMEANAAIPGATLQPVLLTPTQALAFRPDIKAAAAELSARTSLSDAAIAEIFPSFTLGGFYGITDSALLASTGIWNVALGSAVSLLNFGRIEGQINAAQAREKQAFEQYRKTVLNAVSEIETALVDYTYINQQYISLEHAYEAADQALDLSQLLYKEGEISFLDVLDAQRSTNNSESAMISAKSAQVESVVRLFKSLGVY